MAHKKHKKQNKSIKHVDVEGMLPALITEGQQAAAAGRYSEAQVKYEQAVTLLTGTARKKQSKYAHIWLELAELFTRNGQIQSAEKLYKEYMTNALLDGRVADFEKALTSSGNVGGVALNVSLVSVLKQLPNVVALEHIPHTILQRAFDEANTDYEANPSDALQELIYKLAPLVLDAHAGSANGTQQSLPATDIKQQTIGTERLDAAISIAPAETSTTSTPSLFTGAVENSRQAALTAIWKKRVQGTRNYRGSGYGIRVAIYYMLAMLEDTEGIARIELEGIEDFDVYYKQRTDSSASVNLPPRLYVQVKSRDPNQNAWSISELRDEGVINDFAEVHCKDPNAGFLFITDHHFGDRASLAGVLDYENLGEYDNDHPVNDKLRDAITIAPEELYAADFDLSSFIKRIRFRQLPRDLDSIIIEKLALRFNCPKAVAARYYDAIFKKVYELAEADKADDSAKAFTKIELERFLSEIVATVDLSTLEGPLRRANLELLTFGIVEDETPAADPNYYLGVYADLRHILANQDIVRPELMDQLAAKLAKSNFCVIRSPSGSGKTTLMYRFAYEHRQSFAVYRILSLDGAPETIPDIVRYIRSLEPSEQSPVLLLIDNIMRPEKRGWQDLIKPLLENPNVYMVATTREDEWRDLEASDINLEYLTLALSSDTASRFHEKLGQHGQLHPDYPDWLEAYEMSKTNGEALFMEYAHILTQGRRIEEVLREQVARIQQQDAPARIIQMRLLRVICTAHAFGGRVPAVVLPAIVGVEAEELTSHLQFLANEHLIAKEQDYYVGLHELRSQFLRDITHVLPPPALRDTLRLLMEHLPVEELAPILENVCKHDAEDYPAINETVGIRLGRDGNPAILADILRRLYIASEWHHAQRVKVHADRHGINVNEISVLAVPLSPALPGVMESFHSAIFRNEFRTALSTAPKRTGDRFEKQLAPHLQTNELTTMVNGEPNTATIVYFLNWLYVTDAGLAKRVVDGADIEHFATLVRAETSGQKASSLVFHVWRSSEDAYRRLLDALGGQQALIDKLVGMYPSVTQIELSDSSEHGEVVHVRFYADPVLPELGDSTSPHDKTIYLADVCGRMFPAVQRVRTNGLFLTGAPYNTGHHDPTYKDMPVENLPLLEDVERTRIWTNALVAQYTYKTWYTYLQEQDALREKYLISLSNLAGLLEGTRVPNPRISAGYMARISSYVTEQKRLQYQSRILLWPPEQYGAVADPEHASGVYSDTKSTQALHLQLLSGQYYRKPDKDANADSFFRNYTSAVERCGLFLQAYLRTGDRADLAKLRANLASALADMGKFRRERNNLLLRQVEHEALSVAELRILERIYKAAGYVFEHGYKDLWARADTVLSRIQLLAGRLDTVQQEVRAGVASPSTKLAITIISDLVDALPSVSLFAQALDTLQTAPFSPDILEDYVRELRSLTLLDCFVALSEQRYEQQRAAQLAQIEADLQGMGLQVTFGVPILRDDSSGLREETLPVILRVSNLADMLTKSGLVFRRIFAERFEDLQSFALVVTDGESIVWPVIRTFRYMQREQWRVVEQENPNSFLGVCMARPDLLEHYSTYLGMPVAEDSEYLQSIRKVYDGAVKASMKFSQMQEEVRQGRKSADDVERVVELPLDELTDISAYEDHIRYIVDFEPAPEFAPFHIDARNFVMELIDQLQDEVNALTQLVIQGGVVGTDERAPSLAQMAIDGISDLVRSGSILQSTDEVKERIASWQDRTYEEMNAAAKLDLLYLFLKNYFHFGIMEYPYQRRDKIDPVTPE